MSMLNHRPNIWPAERLILSIAGAALILDGFLIFMKGANLDWLGYARILTICLGMVGVGLYYRLKKRSEKIGAATMATGVFLLFSLSISLFNYLLLPVWRDPIDPALNLVDQWIGYHWPSMIAWAAEHPVVNEATRIGYISTMPQIASLLILLGLSGQVRNLHILLVSVAITATFAVCFWSIFPSMGPIGLFDLPQDLEQTATPFVGSAYGKELRHLFAFGPELISPKDVKGLIGFPSYHIVLSMLAIYAARNLKWVFLIYIVLNLLIVPGIFFHGGHHLVDLPAGLLLAAVGIWVAKSAVDGFEKRFGLPQYVAS